MFEGHQINVKSFCFNPFRENTHLVWDETGNCVVVDPGCYGDAEYRALKASISGMGLSLKAVWLTHGHFDHLFGVASLVREYPVPVYMSPGDRIILERDGEYASGVGLAAPDVSFATIDVKEGDTLGQLSLPFIVIATPGHTPGCVCYYCREERLLFTGDTLFAGSIGRTDLPGGDYDKEIVGIMEKLMDLPGDVDVLPGHGPATSIAEERTGNPFLQPFNEPWEFETETD